MLIGISPVLNPDLLATLYIMGHGDEIVLADAHFPGHSVNDHVIRSDGLMITDLLEGILPLFKLDSYVDAPLIMMDAVPGDTLDPTVEAAYRSIVDTHWPDTPPIQRIERFAFYDRSREAFVLVMTGDTAKYGNIILKKGVTPV